MAPPGYVHLRLHAAPSADPFGVSHLYGGPRQPVMPIGEVGKVLREAVALRQAGASVVAAVLDEPTRHPDFVQVQERLLGGDLVLPDVPYMLTTNGEGLVSCPEGHITRLAQAGVAGVIMNWYGQERTHDEFVGRPGAFAGQMAALRRLMETNLELGARLILHRGSAPDLPSLRDRLLNMGPKPPTVEIALPESAGRAAEPRLRARPEDLTGWTAGMRQALKARTEVEWAQHVAETSDLSGANLADMDSAAYLDIYGDLSVYANLRQPLPYAFLPRLRVGKLGPDALPALVEAAARLPLLLEIRRLTCRRLAESHDPANPALYTLRDLLENVWPLRLLQP